MHAQRLFASLLICLGLLSSGTAMSETIQVSIDGKSYPVEMADNADARAFIARLPMTLTFENFGRNERIAYPKPALELERSARHFEITRGTMTVYKPWGIPVEFRPGRPRSNQPGRSRSHSYKRRHPRYLPQVTFSTD